MALTTFSVGHSNTSLEDFFASVAAYAVVGDPAIRNAPRLPTAAEATALLEVVAG